MLGGHLRNLLPARLSVHENDLVLGLGAVRRLLVHDEVGVLLHDHPAVHLLQLAPPAVASLLVPPQVGVHPVSLTTRGAHVRPVACVRRLVILPLAGVGELAVAGRVAAAVALALAGVDPLVRRQVALGREPLAADGALEGPLLRVGSLVENGLAPRREYLGIGG